MPSATLLHDCIIRDLRSAAYYRALDPERQDESDPESELFYLIRAVGYQEDLEALRD